VKTTTRVKKINGHEYLYEITYYYDKETKRTRQKSRYLGKYVDGKPVRVREKAKSPERVYSYGEFIPFLTAIRALKLQEILGAHLSEHETRISLTLAIAAMTCPEAIYNPGAWFEGTALSRIFPGLKLSGQTISKILKKLGDTVIPIEICRACLNNKGGAESRVYDLMIPQVRFSSVLHREETDHRFFDQISLYYDKNLSIPAAYLPHPKNLTATDLVKSSVAGMHLFRYRQTTLVSGRRFNSTMNIYGLIFSGTPFIVPIKPENDIIREEIRRHRGELMHPKNLKIFRSETLFIIPISIPIQSMQMHGYICYSPRRDEEERVEFNEDLDLIVESLHNTPIYRWADPADTVKDVAGKYESFIQWGVDNNKLQVNVKKKVIARHLKDAGVSVLLYAGEDYQWDQCLQWTTEQTDDELFYTTISRQFQIYPHTVDAETIRQGIYMIVFLSLMIKRWVERQFETSGLLNVSTIQKIMIDLSKIRLIGLGNDRTIVTGLNPRQKDILDILKWQLDFQT
jgi:transposase